MEVVAVGGDEMGRCVSLAVRIDRSMMKYEMADLLV